MVMNQHGLKIITWRLFQSGYNFDYISDRQLQNCRYENGAIITEGGARYKAIVFPETKYFPVQTMKHVNDLIAAGGQIYFNNKLPEAVPGLHNHEERQQLLNDLKTSSVLEGMIGNITELLMNAGIKGEPSIVDKGFYYQKMKVDGEVWYMIANCSNTGYDEWIEPETDAADVVFYFPENGQVSLASIKGNSVRIQLEPERIVFLQCTDKKPDVPVHDYYEATVFNHELEGLWKISFVEGGPVFPGNISTRKLISWTELGDENAQRFAGTAKYSMEFVWEEPVSKGLLDLGVVYECAKVTINEKDYGSLFGPSYKVVVDNLIQGINVLEVEITNTAANRIRDLDKRGVEWRKFYDINFIGIGGTQFDASKWPVENAGLEGKVTLSPLK